MARQSQLLRKKLLQILSDQALHSGEELAFQIGISRTAIWKHIRYLKGAGIQISSVTGQGYQLQQPLELLDGEEIKKHLKAGTKNRISDLDVLFETDSTNQRLIEYLVSSSIHGRVMLAEYQSGGRGRRGKHWCSPLAGSINLSLGWYYDLPPENLACISLAAGIAVMRALKRMKINDVRLKWPNDIMAGGKKLGGILVETRSESAGAIDIIIGLGINIDCDDAIRNLDQAAIDIATLCPSLPSRNQLTALLIEELILMMQQIPKISKKTLLDEWRKYDYAIGHRATVDLSGQEYEGTVLGIDDDGLLLMKIRGNIKKFTSGQVSLKVT